jgi:hypothetical protein
MALESSVNSEDASLLRKLATEARETVQISVTGVVQTDNTDDRSSTDDGSDDEADGLQLLDEILEPPPTPIASPTTIAPYNESSPVDERSVSLAVAVRSLCNSYDSEQRRVDKTSSKGPASLCTPANEVIQQMMAPVIDERDYQESSHISRKNEAAVIDESSPSAFSPQKRVQTLSSKSDESDESEEPPTKRRRTRRSLRLTRESASDGSSPSRIELLLSSRVRLDTNTRNFFDRQGVSILQNFKQRTPARSTLVHVVPEKGPFRTVKVLRTIIAGGTVVKRSWVRDTTRKSKMQPLQPYVPSMLKTSIELDLTSVFADRELVFTSAARKKIDQWDQVCALAKEAGCAKIEVATKAQIMFPPTESTVCLFGDNSTGDEDADDWIRTHDRVVWDWHLLAHAVIAGQLDLEDDHYKLGLPLGSHSIEYEY